MNNDDSLSTEELLALGRMGLELGYLEQAAAYYDRVLQIDPHHPEALLGKAKACQDPQEALRLLDLLLEIAPDSTEGQRLREEIQRHVGSIAPPAVSQEESAPLPSSTPIVIEATPPKRAPFAHISNGWVILVFTASLIAIIWLTVRSWPRASSPGIVETETATSLSTPTLVVPFLPGLPTPFDSFSSVYRAIAFILVPAEWGTGLQRGSGVLVDKTGLVLTNYHVLVDPYGALLNVDGLAVVGFISDVRFPPDTWYIASLVAYDEARDLAILRILTTQKGEPFQGQSFTPLPWRDALNLTLGEPLIGLGYPTIGGKTLTLTQGTMAGFYTEGGVRFGKTDLELLAGSSGGAVLDVQGRLVGIIRSAMTEHSTQGRLSYFILINEAHDLLRKAQQTEVPSPSLDWILEWTVLNLAEK